MITVYENPWFKVVKDGAFHYLEERGSHNGAVILVLDDAHFIFVKVKRPAHAMELLEAPRGYGNPGESSRECAVRELFEETGFKVEASQLEKLGVVRPNTAILKAKVDIFLARVTAVQKVARPDDEVTDLVYIPQNQIKQEIGAGNISDGFTLSALAFFWSSSP